MDVVEDINISDDDDVNSKNTKEVSFPNETKYGNIKNKEVRNQLFRKDKRAKNKVLFLGYAHVFYLVKICLNV